MEELLLAFIIITLIQLFYFLFFFKRVATFELPLIPEDQLPSVSIVICARNDAHNLHKNLFSILDQDYPRFEVIVVNDNSEDDTELMLMNLSAQYEKLVVRNIMQESNIMKGKKYPLTVGIRAAKFETILVTDADCSVTGRHWIRSIASGFTAGKEIVLGYAPYKKYKGLLNRYIRFETFMTAIQYLSYSLAGIPYMGVGRNMAYRKELFFQFNVYPKHPHLLSGDDDLFINAASNSANTTVQLEKASFMYSEPKKTWEEYWHQKQRHVSTAKFFKFKHQLLLGIFSLTHLLFYGILLLLLLYSQYYLEAGLIFFIRCAIQGVIYFFTMKRLEEGDLFFFFPVMDILILFYYFKLLPGVFEKQQAEWQ